MDIAEIYERGAREIFDSPREKLLWRVVGGRFENSPESIFFWDLFAMSPSDFYDWTKEDRITGLLFASAIWRSETPHD